MPNHRYIPQTRAEISGEDVERYRREAAETKFLKLPSDLKYEDLVQAAYALTPNFGGRANPSDREPLTEDELAEAMKENRKLRRQMQVPGLVFALSLFKDKLLMLNIFQTDEGDVVIPRTWLHHGDAQLRDLLDRLGADIPAWLEHHDHDLLRKKYGSK